MHGDEPQREMAVVAIHEGKKMRSKLDNRGKTCMFVGYAEDHGGDVTEFRQPLQVQSHLEMPGILVQLGHIQRT